MRVSRLETFPVNAAYKWPEVSALTSRRGITQILVRITTDEGLVGWGESPRTADAVGVERAIEAMTPFVLGRDPWDKGAIARDVDWHGMWAFQPMTRNLAYSGIDMALWDVCGKACGQPLYRLFGGALREDVDYFYYLHWDDPDGVKAQAADGVARGYTVFYIKAGVDARREEAMLEALREAIGPERKIRIDCNMAWTVPEAVRLLNRWHRRFDIDFVEAPVTIDPPERTRAVKERVETAICVNEGLGRDFDVIRVIQSRCADYLCFSSYWVGSLASFHSLVHYAHLEGLLVCKHTPGELGLMAAAGQHMMLAAPNACDGHQQTAQMMADDVLAAPLPIAQGPRWGRIEAPGLGVEVDEDKVKALNEVYQREGPIWPYGERVPPPA